MGLKTSSVSSKKEPPKASNNVVSDVWNFLLKKSQCKTKIKFDSEDKRQDFNKRILQRIGLSVDKFSVLNIHQIGIDMPVSYVFNELLNWNGDSTCWPNHVAKVLRVNNRLERIKILPFGMSKYPFGFKKSFFGLRIIPLFYLHAIRIKQIPDPFDFDNARYILYRCSGGYPIGIFTMYARSSIAELNETAQSQLIFAVSFDFFGNEKLSKNKLIRKVWATIHNRVTANVLCRIKQLCEWRIENMASGKITEEKLTQL